jgi:hypothetical protein
MTRPKELLTLFYQKNIWDEEFIKAFDLLKNHGEWDNILTSCYTQAQTWHGAWKKTGI